MVEPTHLKNMLVKLDHLPRDRGENQKCLSCHHLGGVVKPWCFRRFRPRKCDNHHPVEASMRRKNFQVPLVVFFKPLGGGPGAPVINEGITSISRVITPVKPIYIFSAIYRGYNPSYN